MIAMPKNKGEQESLILMVKDVHGEKLVTAVRRMGKSASRRKLELERMNFDQITHHRSVPNSRYLWKRMSNWLRKKKEMSYQKYHDVKSNVNISCYKMNEKIDVDSFIQSMEITENEEEWVRDVMRAVGIRSRDRKRQTRIHRYMPRMYIDC